MALEKADLTSINKYVRDVVNRIPPRPIKAHTIGTLTSDQINVSSPPVVNGTPQPKITTRALSLGPPPNPVDGDIWIASNVDANGTRWQFQYNAESSSAYKWEFIGGSWLVSQDSSGVARSNTVAGTWQQIAGSTPITLVRPGDYNWYAQGFVFTFVQTFNSGVAQETVISVNPGSPNSGQSQAAGQEIEMEGNSASVAIDTWLWNYSHQKGRLNGLGANTVLYPTMYVNNTGNGNVVDPGMGVIPVRVS